MVNFVAAPICILLLNFSLALSASAAEPTAETSRSSRNNVVNVDNLPTDWDLGKYDRKIRRWKLDEARNIKWVSRLGTWTTASPTVVDGRIYIGTNNGGGYLPRAPRDVDLGCLLCFNAEDGEFVWQYSASKLPTGRVQDWPQAGIRSQSLVQGDRLWFVDNRAQVVCLDTEGFIDGEDDGPVQATSEIAANPREADVVWKFDMIGELGVSPHNWSTCSPASYGDLLFITTGNGVDESHSRIPAPNAPSFIAVDKDAGCVVWTDNSPGENILHGQWASPTVGVLGGVPQVIFGGGDGWVYCFRADKWDVEKRRPELLWKFDANLKTSRWSLGGRGTRNSIVASPVIHEGLVYVTVGQDPEHGEGPGHLWCIDPTGRGDISSQLAYRIENGKRVRIPHRRVQAVDPEAGEVAVDNPNSGAVWHYSGFDFNRDGKVESDEQMHRTSCRPVIAEGLLFVPDYYGLVHCLDVKTGRPHWTCDMYACVYGTPLIADGRVFVGDQDGDVAILKLSADASDSTKKDGSIVIPKTELLGYDSIYSDIVAADGVLYLTTRSHLFAIAIEDSRKIDIPKPNGRSASPPPRNPLNLSPPASGK